MTTPQACIAAYAVVGPTNRKPARRSAFESAVDSGVVGASRPSTWARDARSGRCDQKSSSSGCPASRSATRRPGVRDRRLDLAAVPHDPRVGQEPLDVALPNRATASGSKAANAARKPSRLRRIVSHGEPGLEALEAQALVDAALGRDRAPPFLVVVGEVQRIGRRPAPFYGSSTSTLTTPSSTITG